MNEPRLDHEYKGYKIYFQGISLNCPELKLYGFAYDSNLHREINRKLKRLGISRKPTA